jgi:hypothetical protein
MGVILPQNHISSYRQKGFNVAFRRPQAGRYLLTMKPIRLGLPAL